MFLPVYGLVETMARATDSELGDSCTMEREPHGNIGSREARLTIRMVLCLLSCANNSLFDEKHFSSVKVSCTPHSSLGKKLARRIAGPVVPLFFSFFHFFLLQDGKDKENWLKFYVNPYSGMAEAELTEPVALNQANLEVSWFVNCYSYEVYGYLPYLT